MQTLSQEPETLKTTLNPKPSSASLVPRIDFKALGPHLHDKHDSYLEGHGDLVNRLILGITRATMWVIRVINLLTKSP